MTEYEAGRELDKLIAEKVMGWRWYTHAPYCYSGYSLRPGEERFLIAPQSIQNTTGYVEASLELPLAPHWDCTVPHYSTDIAAAWQIIEHLGEKVWLDELANKWESSWRCILANRAPFGTRYYQDWGAETAPLAICRAALQVAEDS